MVALLFNVTNLAIGPQATMDVQYAISSHRLCFGELSSKLFIRWWDFSSSQICGKALQRLQDVMRGGLIHRCKRRSYIQKDFQLSFDKFTWSLSCLSYAFMLLFQLQHHIFLVKGKIVNQSKLCYCYPHGVVFLLGHLSLQFSSY